MINMNYISNRLKKDIKKLQKNSFRKKKGLIVVEGINPLKKAVENNLNLKYLIINKKEKDLINYFFDKYREKIYTAAKKDMRSITSMNTPYKIIGVFKKPDNYFRKNSPTLFLDKLQDPGNLGTLIRSSTAFGIKNIILTPDSVNPFSSKVIRSSSGYIFQVYIEKKEIDFNKYKSKGYTLYGTSLDEKSQGIEKINFKFPYILILGNEGNGISEKYKKYIDVNMKIKMNKNVDSLNVAVAGSIILSNMYKDMNG